LPGREGEEEGNGAVELVGEGRVNENKNIKEEIEMSINLKEYLEDMLKDRRSKYEPKPYDEQFYWGQVCLLEEILHDIKNGQIKEKN